MDNYEVNVLTRKGGWKKLPQEILDNKNNSKQNNNELNFNVNRKYAILNNKQLMLIQDYVFNKVLININELVEWFFIYILKITYIWQLKQKKWNL